MKIRRLKEANDKLNREGHISNLNINENESNNKETETLVSNTVSFKTINHYQTEL